jgi:hypothetical protein
LRGVADRFGITVATAWNSLYKICRKLLEVNRINKIIAWPNEDKCDDIMNRINNKHGFPGRQYLNLSPSHVYNYIVGVVGIIDGSHIPIKAPHQNGVAYVNRKGFHSMLLQGVCDDQKLFLDCYAGEAGSIHDACMFRRSDLGRTLDTLNFPQNSHLIGDSAYQLHYKLIVPFKDNGHLTNPQRHFNTKLSKVRVTIEQTFALLKGRFRRLKLLEAVRSDLLPLLIITACILHNICQGVNDILPDVNIDEELEEERLMNPENEAINDHINNPNALAKRNNIVNLLYMRR